MKRVMLVFLFLILSIVTLSPALAQDTSMMCPGHSGTTIESLRMCVTHAAADGHITNRGVANSLFAKLDGAQAAFDRGQKLVAVNILKAFVNEVQAQAGKHIHIDHAQHMVDHAQRVIAALGG